MRGFAKESYVRPPLYAREPAPRWHGVWRFRLVAIVLILLLAWAVLIITLSIVNTEGGGSPGLNPLGLSPAYAVGHSSTGA